MAVYVMADAAQDGLFSKFSHRVTVEIHEIANEIACLGHGCELLPCGFLSGADAIIMPM